MFEKFSNLDVDSAGGGGEYTVQVCISFPLSLTQKCSVECTDQAGFGWTNGVVLWIASNYGPVLSDPQCPPLLVDAASDSSNNGATGVGLSYVAVMGTVVMGAVVQLLYNC
jgi:alpha,alpha-trehalase